MTLQTGSRFGPYEILARLGAGGMGEVWRARDPRLDREVAVKVLPALSSADETARLRLLREARMAARLNHPNVCTIHEVGEAEGQAYIAMELVAGQTLSDRLSAGGLSMDQVVRLGQQMADALAHAHEHGVVHRDFKSGNVIVTADGRAKVLDFGLAKPLASEDLEAATTVSGSPVSEAGAVTGTLAYMAPEQVCGKPADARSDIWALGVVLYEMVAGRRPFEGSTGYALSSAIVSQAPKALPSGVPTALASVIARCLAKEPGQRYQRAGEVRAALDVLELSRPIEKERRRKSNAAPKAQGGRPRIRGVAVLPLLNLSNDAEQEYFVDGMTEALTAELACLRGLRVISRTSAMRYRGSAKSIPEIAAELNVDGVVEGSVLRAGDRVRITAQLIHAASDAHLWAGSYQRDVTDVLTLQAEIAGAIASEIGLRLSPPERERLTRARPVNHAALESYLIGSYEWRKLTPAGFDAAQRYFEAALARSPDMAGAHAGVALVWIGRQQMGLTKPAQAAPLARAAATRAVELAPDLAEAHYVLALLAAWTDWDWTRAEIEFERALALRPGFADALMYHSHLLACQGRIAEAVAEGERAVELDPFNDLFQTLFAVDLYYANRYRESLQRARAVLQGVPDNPPALASVWLAAAKVEQHAEAVAAARRYVTVIYAADEADHALGEGFAAGGYREAMHRGAAALARRSQASFVLPFDVAMLSAEAGLAGEALDWLDKGLEMRDPGMPYLGVPVFEPLRSEPRYQALLRTMNLPMPDTGGDS